MTRLLIVLLDVAHMRSGDDPKQESERACTWTAFGIGIGITHLSRSERTDGTESESSD